MKFTTITLLFFYLFIHQLSAIPDSLRALLTNEISLEQTDLRHELIQHFSNQAPDSMLHYAQAALAIAREMDDEERLFLSHERIGKSYLLQRENELAIKAFSQAENYREYANADRQFKLLIDMARAYLRLSKNQECTASFRKAIAFAEAIGDQEKQISAMSLLGNAYRTAKDLPNAFKYLNRALELIGDRSPSKEEMWTRLRLGLAYNRNGENQRSLEEMLAIPPRFGSIMNAVDSIYIYDNIGRMYHQNGRYDESVETLLIALEIENRIDHFMKEHTLIELMTAHGFKKEVEKAIGYGQQVLNLKDNIDDLYMRSDIERNFAEIYEQAGDFQNALKHRLQYEMLEDSIYNTEREAITAEMEAKYENEKQQQELLQKESEIQLATLQRNGFLMGAALLALIAFLLWRRYTNKRSANELLQQKNQEIEQQRVQLEQSLLEKETLLREIHHRVKNNLQVISSLLNLQSERERDTRLLASIREGQSRVQTMSLIHQNLYQSDNLGEIDMEFYLKQLVTYLDQAFAVKGKSVKTLVHAPDVLLDIDTAIPVGLIINELVTNAYKYAFAEQHLGLINIRIKKKDLDQFELLVKDNGKGIPSDFQTEKSNSLGLRLVHLLTRQIGGRISFEQERGTQVSVTFWASQIARPQLKVG